MTVHYPPPLESGVAEPLHIYVVNAMALPPLWRAALLRLQIEGPLYRIGAGRFYGRRSDQREIMIPDVVARALERHEFVRFGCMGNQRVPALYATERGKRYGIALAVIDTYEKRRAALTIAAPVSFLPPHPDRPDAAPSCPDETKPVRAGFSESDEDAIKGTDHDGRSL
jgi:hypothetical protein